MDLTPQAVLPGDARATLIGRAWLPGPIPGPSPVLIDAGKAFDLSEVAPTSSELLSRDDAVAAARSAVASRRATPIGTVADMLANSVPGRRDASRPYFLCPVDLQAVRACGVTFIASMLERVIEEQAKGDPARAESLRHGINEEIGAQLNAIKPGSPQAMKLKESLIKRGAW